MTAPLRKGGSAAPGGPVRQTPTPAPIQRALSVIRPRPWLRNSLLAGPAGLWLLLFQGVPMLLILVMSFGKRTGTGAVEYTFNTGNYVRFADPLYLKILGNSFMVALGVTVFTLLIGYPLAYFIASQPPTTRPRWLFLVIVPFWTSMLIRTYGWKFLLRSDGVFNWILLKLHLISQPLDLLYTEGAAMLGLVYMLLPFMVLPIYTSVEKLDTSLIRAAYDLGARPWRTFLTVILPLTLPGVAAGAVLVMVPSIGLFYVADLLGGAKTVLIGNLIQRQFTSARDWPFGAASSVILVALTLALVFLYIRGGGKEDELI